MPVLSNNDKYSSDSVPVLNIIMFFAEYFSNKLITLGLLSELYLFIKPMTLHPYFHFQSKAYQSVAVLFLILSPLYIAQIRIQS